MVASDTPDVAKTGAHKLQSLSTVSPVLVSGKSEDLSKQKRAREGLNDSNSSGYELQNPPQINRAPNRRRKADPRKWTEEEDDALRRAVQKHGEKNWKAIADQIIGRNHTQCLQRWTKVLAPGLKKGPWQPNEDELLRNLVAEGRRNWGQVASKIPGRTSKQCRERWYNHLDPQINKNPFSEEEDKVILQAQAMLGNRWSQIASMLEGRTEDAVKIRWKSLCRKLAKQVAERRQEQLAGASHHHHQQPAVSHHHHVVYGVPSIAQAFAMNQAQNKNFLPPFPTPPAFHQQQALPSANNEVMWGPQGQPKQNPPPPLFFQQQHFPVSSMSSTNNSTTAISTESYQHNPIILPSPATSSSQFRSQDQTTPNPSELRIDGRLLPSLPITVREVPSVGNNSILGRASLDEFLKELAGDPSSSRLSSTAGILSELLMNNNGAEEDVSGDMWRISGSMNRLSL